MTSNDYCKQDILSSLQNERLMRLSFWLELLEEKCGIPARLIQPFWKEADELIRI